MKVVFLEEKYDAEIKLGKNVSKLPQKVCLISTIQYVNCLAGLKKEIEKTGRKVVLKKVKQKYPGQVLGCESSAADVKADAYLYIGTGKFHPLNFAISGKTVFTYDGKNLDKITNEEVENLKNKKKAAYVKYLTADRIGILVTTNPGQSQLKKAIELKKKFEKKGKKAYIFVDNTINYASLENFPFIQAWVNTGCPRIIEDFNAVNIEDVS